MGADMDNKIIRNIKDLNRFVEITKSMNCPSVKLDISDDWVPNVIMRSIATRGICVYIWKGSGSIDVQRAKEAYNEVPKDAFGDS